MARYKYLRRQVVNDRVVVKSQSWFAKRNNALAFLAICLENVPMNVALDLYAKEYGHRLTPKHLAEIMKVDEV